MFVIDMDHYNLKFMLDQHLATIPQHQWASKLIRFDFRMEYKPDAANIVADALSCRDKEEATEVMALFVLSFQVFNNLRWELNTDTTLAHFRRK
jgi:hypothetical protein